MGAGEAARAVAWAAAAGLVARHTAGTWQLARTLAWLSRAEDGERGPSGSRQLPAVHVIVPVLREQEHIGAALTWWRQILPAFPGMSLTIVSTAREEHERNLLAFIICQRSRLTRAEFPQLTESELAGLSQALADAGGHLDAETAAKILARTPLTRDV